MGKRCFNRQELHHCLTPGNFFIHLKGLHLLNSNKPVSVAQAKDVACFFQWGAAAKNSLGEAQTDHSRNLLAAIVSTAGSVSWCKSDRLQQCCGSIPISAISQKQEAH
jgi:hypothetical protein